MHLRDTTENIIVGVLVELAVSAKVKETARGVIRSGAESLAVGEELHGVNIRLVTQKRLDALSGPDVPNLCCGITGSRNKNLLLRRDGKTKNRGKERRSSE